MSLHVDRALERDSLPQECIEDCSAMGRVDDAVAYWMGRLGFTVNREHAIAYLTASGGWEPEELQAEEDAILAERILWLACCSFNEDPGSDLFYLEG